MSVTVPAITSMIVTTRMTVTSVAVTGRVSAGVAPTAPSFVTTTIVIRRATLVTVTTVMVMGIDLTPKHFGEFVTDTHHVFGATNDQHHNNRVFHHLFLFNVQYVFVTYTVLIATSSKAPPRFIILLLL
jgi:hypothetical protein